MLSTEEVPSQHDQRAWDQPLCEKIIVDFRSGASEEDVARLNATASKHAGAWLQAIPITNNGLKLTDEEIRVAICLRLGLKIYEPFPCACGNIVDQFGSHCFSCKKNSGRILRHEAINHLLHRELTKCDLSPTLEPTGLLANSPLRPDGVTRIPFERGRQLAWDFTCTHPLCPSIMRLTNGLPGQAAALAEERKFSKYKDFSTEYIFVPIAMETLGAFAPAAACFIEKIGKRLEALTGIATSKTYLRQRLSVELQRGNARCVLFGI